MRSWGNKQLGWLATAVFLEINGVAVRQSSNDDLHDLVMDVAAEPGTIAEVAAHLLRIVPGDSVGGDARA